MKAVKEACVLQEGAQEITVGDQIEDLDQIIQNTDGNAYFEKTFITDGMRTLLEKGIARLAGKSNDAVFHLKQAMGGGKTHLMVCFGLLAKDKKLRSEKISFVSHNQDFDAARVAAFNGRNQPECYFWGEIAKQLGREDLFAQYWTGGPKSPDKAAWLRLFDTVKDPLLILLDELPPYFHYYSTQTLGTGTIADVATTAFANLLAAAKDKKNVCVIISDLNAAYSRGGALIQSALDDAKQELGRTEISITPVNLESNEIYDILRKRLFLELPTSEDIADIASAFATKLSEAAKAKTVQRGAEGLAAEIESTYPFHPSFKHIVALFKDNEKFKQTRGLMELVSRLLKSVWESRETVYLIGAQHFDLSLVEVREKIAEISGMREVIAKDLWDVNQGAHAQVIDANAKNNRAEQVGTLLLLSSLSTATNAVKGLSEVELYENLIDPLHCATDFTHAFERLQKDSWYIHQEKESETDPGRFYFDRQENLTKKLQGYAEKAPQNRVNELIRLRLNDMFKPSTKEAYDQVLALPEIDEARTILSTHRNLLILDPDGKIPPKLVESFFQSLTNKNNMLVLTGQKSNMASVEEKARQFFATLKIEKELPETHVQFKELETKKDQYNQDFQATLLSVFDTILYPRKDRKGADILKSKPLDSSYSANEAYNGERQIIKTLTSDPIKLYTNVIENYDALRSKIESVLFGHQESLPKSLLTDGFRQNTAMPWVPPNGLKTIISLSLQNGQWEELENGYISKNPRPKATKILVTAESEGDDGGYVKLHIEVANAGSSPRIYYAEDATVSENSPILKEQTLTTNALRVQFLAVDPTGTNSTGNPETWTNTLKIRAQFEESSRKVTLFVAPRAKIIRYTLDSSEPRNGIEYTEPIQLGNEKVTLSVFAECEGLEKKATFSYGDGGEIIKIIDPTKPTTLISSTGSKRLDTINKIKDALDFAKSRQVIFENITLTVNSASISINNIPVSEKEIGSGLQYLHSIFESKDTVALLTFRKANFNTGRDFEEFCKKVGIEIKENEVEQ